MIYQWRLSTMCLRVRQAANWARTWPDSFFVSFFALPAESSTKLSIPHAVLPGYSNINCDHNINLTKFPNIF